MVPASGRFSVLFSGGLDSSLLAFSARDRNPDVELLTVGVGDAADLRAARSAARILGMNWCGYRLDRPEVSRARNAWAPEIGSLPEPARSVALALALALERATGAHVLCGQGADELFLGYAHFAGLAESGRIARAREDLSRLETVDWPRTCRVAARCGRSLASPYLDPEFRDRVLALPPEVRADPDELRKPVLRALARRVGLPEAIAGRPKRALQYGSGVRHALAHIDLRVSAEGAEDAPAFPPRRAGRVRATENP